MTQLCAISGCRIRCRHLTPCADDDCAGCLPRSTEDGHACDVCVDRTADRLKAISDLTGPARLVAAGLVRRGDGGVGGKPGSRSPGNDDALDALNAIQGALTTIARDIAETRGLHFVSAAFEGHRVADPLVEAATWLSDQLGWVRHATDDQGGPYAVAVFAEIGDCASRMRSIVDGPSAKRYLGPCGAISHCEGLELDDWPEGDCGNHTPHPAHDSEPCDGDVRGRIGADKGTCQTCGATVDQHERRIWLDEQVRDKGLVARAALIADAYGINVKTIRSWATEITADNGRIIRAARLAGYYRAGEHVVPWTEPKPGEVRGPKVFYVADVLDLAREAADRRAQRETARAAVQGASA